ncbi:MAG: response regulator transcription factor [Oscillospiraceae bacterium]|jgi:DNA-binding response OmpR family regulator|nr:response regulator transcription factor [Oscillospiraceae bacterium]
MNVLIVEDERKLADVLEHILKEEKYIVDAAYNGNDGLAYALTGTYDVIILDVMLPGMNGFDIVRRMRNEKNSTPVLMLTAKGEINDRVHGLDCGADDYMQKPFSSDELLARIRALTRRQGEIVLEVMEYGDLTLRLDNHELSCRDKSVRLSLKEYEVLKLLVVNKNQVLTKDIIITKVWGYDSEAENNNLEAYISFLRKKLTYLESGVMIDVLRKVGYTLKYEKNG